MMVGFVQMARGKLMEKVQKLGKFVKDCEGLWMTSETYEKWDDVGYFIDVLWVEVCCKRSTHLTTETEQEKD